MIKIISHISMIIMVTITIYSCNVINPDEPIPTYLQVDSILVKDDQGNIIPSNIRTAFVSYSDGNKYPSAGTFVLPFTAPILNSASAELSIVAGVYTDGDLTNASQYPMLKVIKSQMPHAPGDTVKLGILYATQIDSLVTKFDDGFEGGTQFSVTSPDSLGKLIIENFDVRSGFGSGQLTMVSPRNDIQIISNNDIILDYNHDTYLQFDYKSNVDFGVSLYYYNSTTNNFQEYNLSGVRAKSNWNRIYFFIRDEIGSLNSSRFRIAFKVKESVNHSPVNLLLDNVQIVTK